MFSLLPYNTFYNNNLLSDFDDEDDYLYDYNSFRPSSYRRQIQHYNRPRKPLYKKRYNPVLYYDNYYNNNLSDIQSESEYEESDYDSDSEFGDFENQLVLNPKKMIQSFNNYPNILKKQIRKDKNNNQKVYISNKYYSEKFDENGNKIVTKQVEINENGEKKKVIEKQVFDKDGNLKESEKKEIGGDQLKQIEDGKQQIKSDKKIKSKKNKKLLKQKKAQKEQKVQENKNILDSNLSLSSIENSNSSEVIIEDELTGEQQTYSQEKKDENNENDKKENKEEKNENDKQ